MRMRLGFLAVVGLFLFAGVVPANGFSITPARVRMAIDPGGSQVTTIQIENDTSSTVKYELRVVGARQSESGAPQFAVGSSELENWIVLDASSTVVQPHRLAGVGITVNVPAAAASGVSHFAGIEVSPVVTASSSIGISSKVVSLVTVTVAGTVHESVAQVVWRSTHFAQSGGVWPIAFSLKNSGTSVLPLGGTIALEDVDGRSVTSTPAHLGTMVFPQTARSITLPVVGMQSFLPRYYRVVLNLDYGYTHQKLKLVTGVFYLSIYFKVLFLGIILVTALYFLYRHRSRGV